MDPLADGALLGFLLPPPSLQAGPAEGVAAGEHDGVLEEVAAHRTGQVVLEERRRDGSHSDSTLKNTYHFNTKESASESETW